MSTSYKIPFSKSLIDNLDKIRKRIEGNKASLIIIDGGLGEGKTTLAIEIADYENYLKGLPEVDPEGSQLAMGGAEFLKKIRVCFERGLPVIIYDEAGDFARRGALTSFNQMINRTFETFRAFKILVILVLPSFFVLDQQILDKQIPRLYLHLKNRTIGCGNFYGYSLYRLLLLRYYMSKSKMRNYSYKRVVENIRGHFKNLNPERAALLDKVSTKNKLHILRKSEIAIEGLLTVPDIAIRVTKTILWTRNTIKALNIQPDRQIKRIKYYRPDCLGLIADRITDRGPK